jgi:hypothetical protein
VTALQLALAVGQVEGRIAEMEKAFVGLPYSARRFGGTSADWASGVAVDRDGYVVVGTFQGTIDLGGGPVSSVVVAGVGPLPDAFVAKFSKDGAHLWSRRLGGTLADAGHDVAVDASTGDVCVTGSFRGTSDLGGGTTRESDGRDAFVACYSGKLGEYLWSHALRRPGNDEGLAIAAVNGRIVVTGTFDDGSSGADAFVAMFSQTGDLRWTESLGDGNQLHDRGTGIALDADGSVFVSGVLDEGDELNHLGRAKAFLARYSSAGVLSWSSMLRPVSDEPGSNESWGGDVRLSGTDKPTILVAGTFAGGVSADSSLILKSAGGTDVFLVEYSLAGTPLTVRRFGGTGNDSAAGLDVASDGDVYLTGSFDGTISLGGDELAGARDIFAARFSRVEKELLHAWSRRIGGAGNDLGSGIAFAPGRDAFPREPAAVFVTGSIEGMADVGAGVLSSAGSSDALLLGLRP